MSFHHTKIKSRVIGVSTDGAGSRRGMKKLKIWDHAPDSLLLWYLI